MSSGAKANTQEYVAKQVLGSLEDIWAFLKDSILYVEEVSVLF